MSYERSKELARDRDPKIRRDLATRDDVAPEVLYYLAEDCDPSVRKAVARNSAAPVRSGLILASDLNVQVRCALAEKVSRLTPDFEPESQEKAAQHVIKTLEALAQDKAVEVRQVLAESLCELPNAPRAVIRKLAEDVEDSVACLILEASPLLADSDLLAIISKSERTERLQSLSRRPNLSAQVSDAIVGRGDDLAVTELLRNDSAQIREETLDRLVAEAPSRPMWHEPLVERPKLSGRSLERLAAFVTNSLLAKLEKHPALDKGTAARIASTLRRRLGESKDLEGEADRKIAREVQCCFKDGKLNSVTLTTALCNGRRDFVIDAIALLADKPRDFVVKVLESASAKGVTALAWKAGLTMRLATQIQFQIGKVMPRRALYERPNGDYPLSEGEMVWQLDFFESLDAKAEARGPIAQSSARNLQTGMECAEIEGRQM